MLKEKLLEDLKNSMKEKNINRKKCNTNGKSRNITKRKR